MSIFTKKDDTRQQMKDFIAQLAERVASGEYDVLQLNINPDPEDNQASVAITLGINTAPVSFNKITQEIGPSERRYPGATKGRPDDDTRWPDGVPKTREMIAYEGAVKEGRAPPLSPEIRDEMKRRSDREAERDFRQAEQEEFRRKSAEMRQRERERLRSARLRGDPDWDDQPNVDPKFNDPKLVADPTSRLPQPSIYEPSRIRPGTPVRDLIFEDPPDTSDPSP